MTTTEESTTVSAPGKVLLAGGYLILESPNVGYVVATDKRFYTTVNTTTTTTTNNKTTNNNNNNNNDDETNNTKTTTIVVKSPQFHCQWSYDLVIDDDGGLSLLSSSTNNNSNTNETTKEQQQSENPFVEKTLRVVFAALMEEAIELQEEEKEQGKGVSTSSSSHAKVLQLRNDDTCDTVINTTIEIIIQADNDFYSIVPHIQERQKQQQQESDNNNDIITVVDTLPKFLPCPKDSKTGKAIVHKTGLGSSAALVTSLVGALYLHFTATTITTISSSNPTINKTTIIHNLAQLCHCYAQGKVGSGFDVSAAMYGSHIYTRFPKCILSEILQQLDVPLFSISCGTESLITQVISKSWWMSDDVDMEDIAVATSTKVEVTNNNNNNNNKSTNNNNDTNTTTTNDTIKTDHAHAPMLSLPNGIQILLADVNGGSESPSMARTVISWKQKQLQTNHCIPSIWKDLSKLNTNITIILQKLKLIDTTDEYNETLNEFSNITSNNWKNTTTTTTNDENNNSTSTTITAKSLLIELYNTFQQIRQLLKQMGNDANVPIEPDQQTLLCNETINTIPGIISCLVPGAGGYDAIACVYIDKSTIKHQIGTFWSKYKIQNNGDDDNNNNNNSSSPSDDDNNTIMVCPLAVQGSTEGIRIENSKQ